METRLARQKTPGEGHGQDMKQTLQHLTKRQVVETDANSLRPIRRTARSAYSKVTPATTESKSHGQTVVQSPGHRSNRRAGCSGGRSIGGRISAVEDWEADPHSSPESNDLELAPAADF